MYSHIYKHMIQLRDARVNV